MNSCCLNLAEGKFLPDSDCCNNCKKRKYEWKNLSSFFKSHFKLDLPVNKDFFCEAPDFIIDKIGYEVISVMRHSEDEGTANLASHGFLHGYSNEIRNILQGSGFPNCRISISTIRGVSRENKDDIRRTAVKILLEHFKENAGRVSLQWENRPWSQEYSEFNLIDSYPLKNDLLVTFQSGAFWVDECGLASIQNALDKKESKLNSYRKKCERINLLLVIESANAETGIEIGGKAVNHVYKSSADAVYVLQKGCCPYRSYQLCVANYFLI